VHWREPETYVLYRSHREDRAKLLATYRSAVMYPSILSFPYLTHRARGGGADSAEGRSGTARVTIEYVSA
jgi:hypothetical protein